MPDSAVVPDQLCPYCGYHFNRAANFEEPGLEPKTGDVMICLQCGKPGMFGADGKLRKPTPEEVNELIRTPEYQLHLAAWNRWNQHGR